MMRVRSLNANAGLVAGDNFRRKPLTRYGAIGRVSIPTKAPGNYEIMAPIDSWMMAPPGNGMMAPGSWACWLRFSWRLEGRLVKS